MADVVVAFLWHQHQPYYPDDVAGDNPMPWVRLHGIKDYYGMALHLLEVPEMRCTINLVPSLVRQLLAYATGQLSDRFLDVTRIPADSLTESDCLFLLDHFFMANHDHMVRPFPRYADLLHRRNLGRNTAGEALRRFQERDLRDLQVWFNLAWTHPLAVERDETLRGLRDKGRHFTEADKQALLERHADIIRQIIPLHRQLAESGQIELTTTPYFHPILPLLFDKKLARESIPDVKLPRYSGGYPDDAAEQVRRAVQQHEQVFGSQPVGMWPSEGSVCQAMLPLLARHAIRWLATDEEILSASTHGEVHRDSKGHVVTPERLYQPYRVRDGSAELQIVFRDHALSDLIGFHYQRSDPAAAAEHFLGCLHGIGQSIATSEPALVPIILDGENCWEHYPGGGVAFLRTLYERCSKTPGVKPLTIGDYLAQHPARATLPQLFPGSWIGHNFAIWVGHHEDNTAWDALHRTRDYLLKRGEGSGVRGQELDNGRLAEASRAPAPGPTCLTPDPSPLTPMERAWEEIYIAEGSDWFWWYGDENSSAQDSLFDYLFRKHLQNVYLLLGDVPPPELARPINRRAHASKYTQPRAFLEVKIDGRYSFFEWVAAGHYACQNERGTMALARRGPFKDIYFGFSLDLLFIRLDCEARARTALVGFDAVRIVFVEPAGREVRIDLPGTPKQTVQWLEEAKQAAPPAGLEVGLDLVLEVAVPFGALGMEVDGSLQFYVELVRDGQGLDRAPREGTIALKRPSRDFERIMWDV